MDERRFSFNGTSSTRDHSIKNYRKNRSYSVGNMTEELGTPYVGTVDLEWGLGAHNNYGYLNQNFYNEARLPGKYQLYISDGVL